MTAARRLNRISVEDYLAGELASPVKHEFWDGIVYAMAGAVNNHNLIAMNIGGVLHAQLRGTKCRPYNSDTKVRIRVRSHIRFYYPDVSVICRPNPPTDSFQDEPVVIAEVISKSTRRIDKGEKRDAYLSINSLKVYLLVEQDSPEILVYRRSGEEFVEEVYEGLDAVIPLDEVGVSLALRDVYETVVFTPEVSED